MTPEETTTMHIANCHACLLALSMRDCRNCAFRVGLEVLKDAEPKQPVMDLQQEQQSINTALAVAERLKSRYVSETNVIDALNEEHADDRPAEEDYADVWCYPDYDYLGTHVTISGGEVVELGKFTSPVDEIPY